MNKVVALNQTGAQYMSWLPKVITLQYCKLGRVAVLVFHKHTATQMYHAHVFSYHSDQPHLELKILYQL